MTLTRRDMLGVCAAASSQLWAADPEPAPRTRLGVVIHSYAMRTAADKNVADPLAFVDLCHQRGAAGVQVGIGARDKEYTDRLRAKVEACKMYLEGSVRLPQDRTDVDRFTREIQTAK